MINILNSPLKVAIFTYLLTFLILYIVKPKIMFNKNKHVRQFGTCKGKTILPIWLVSAIAGILAYNISTLIRNFLLPLYRKLRTTNLKNILDYRKEMVEINLEECD